MMCDGEVDHIITAALLLYYIAKRHCFVDGNKRVAWAVCVSYLAQLNLRIIANSEEAEYTVKNIAESRATKEQVIEWLTKKGRIGPFNNNIP